jgi:hypothetical protein
VFGFVSAMIIVGMLSIGFEMLPFGDSVLGFQRFMVVKNDTNQPPTAEELQAGVDYSDTRVVRNSVWLKPGAFTAGLVSHLSGNALAGQTRFSSVYPDFMAAVQRARAGIGDATTIAKPTGEIRVDGYWDLRPNEFFTRKHTQRESKTWIELTPHKEAGPRGKWVGVRVTFRDVEDPLIFTTDQVRLVVVNATTGAAEEYLPVGMSDAQYPNRLVAIYPGEPFQREPAATGGQLDFVFDLPESVRFGEGSFIEYKQNARAAITPRDDANDPKKRLPPLKAGKQQTGSPSSGQPSPLPTPGSPSGSGDSSQDPGSTNSGSRPLRGRVAGIGEARHGYVTDRLPFTLTRYAGNPDISGGAIRGGRLMARLNNDWEPLPGDQQPIERIHVPPDMRLIQIDVEKLQPGSFLGRARGAVSDMVADFYMIDSRGEKHMPIGMYAIAVAGTQPTFEMVLLDEGGRSGEDVFGKLAKFETIKRDMLRDEYAYYLIFQVKPGTRAVKIHTGHRDEADLQHLNLVAQ